MPEAGSREWLTIGEAAEELGLAHASLLDAVRRRALTVTKVNPRLSLVHRDEVERYRREHLGRHGPRKGRQT
jgi:excisionase family DNA binding protein